MASQSCSFVATFRKFFPILRKDISCDFSLMTNFRTLTTPVPLIKCLKSIKQHAFVSSPYPVIITLEDHLTPDLQAKVAEVRF